MSSTFENAFRNVWFSHDAAHMHAHVSVMLDELKVDLPGIEKGFVYNVSRK